MTKCLTDFTAVKTTNATVFHGSNLDVLPFMADNSVDSIVTDPPYELGFMGKSWDSTGIAYNVEVWTECLRVLKPGGHLLAFGGSRTWHRMAVAIEDAGFELRDNIAWLYGSGFPKSHNISKAIDKVQGGQVKVGKAFKVAGEYGDRDLRDPETQGASREEMRHKADTDDAKKWSGWGTALKPAFEPVVVGRKPLSGTIAENVLEWGVGGLNIDASRIGMTAEDKEKSANNWKPHGYESKENIYEIGIKVLASNQKEGRWPANLILDEYTAGLLDEQSEDVSRFFYVAKASKRDRNEGLDELPETQASKMTGRSEGSAGLVRIREDGSIGENPYAGKSGAAKNFHPTVKPTDLMRYLIKLVTPAGGVVLDPFTGSGSTGKAALLDGYQFLGIEMTDDYLPIIQGRLDWAEQQATQADEKENEKLF